MTNTRHKVVTATYNMYDITDGQNFLIESANDTNPLNIVTGLGMTPIKALEEKLAKLNTGEDYELTLTADTAFGEYDKEAVFELDKQSFYVNGTFDENVVKPGAVIPMQNENGERFAATVLEVDNNAVKLDFNHPFAGKTLLFSGKIIEAHEASDEEILAVTTQSSCGCGGSCGGDCDCEGDGECNCGGSCGGGCSCS